MLHDMLTSIRFHMLTSPQAIALVTWSQTMTFGALGARVQGIIAVLAGEPPSTQLITGHKEPDVVAAMLACAFTGRPFVFADRSNPPERTARIRAVANPSGGLAAGACPDLQGLPIRALAQVPGLPLLASSLATPDEAGIFHIIFTSGSTGEPKGVPVSRRNFAVFRGWYEPMLEAASPGGAHVNHASLGFDMGMLDLWPTLALGRPVIMLDHANNVVPRNNLRHLVSCPGAAVGSWFSTPSLLRIMCTDPQFCEETLPALRCVFVGGELVQRALVRELMQRFPRLVVRHAYGPSEVTCVTHAVALTAADVAGDGPLPLGQVIAPNGMRLLDAAGEEVALGEPGEIVLSGPQVVQHYLPVTHPANAAFGRHRGQPTYRTGDLGRVDAAGCLTVLGRADRQVKWNGNRIELDEIERTAAAIPEVQQAACLPLMVAGQVTDIVLFVQPHPGAPISRTQVLDCMARALPQVMLPRDLRLVDSLPVTVNGKLDRGALLHGLAAAAA